MSDNHLDHLEPLAGVRVLDLSRVLAGPWATQLLADLGAEVVKVERPGEGDDTRSWGPPFLAAADGDDGVAAYFLCANRGKKSVCLDLASAEGQETVRRLATKADVFVENFKVGDLARYGLDYASLAGGNPRLVYCSITGFGQDGPYAARAGYDFVIQGMGGLMSVTGAPDEEGGEPMKVGIALVDIMTGLYTSSAILAALQRRHASGRGAYIDMALMDVQVATLANQASAYLVSGKTPGRGGNVHPSITPYETFATEDGSLNVAIGNDGQFRKLCEVLGAAELAADPRFATNSLRTVNRPALRILLQSALVAWPTAKWCEVLATKGVPAGPINDLAAVFADPHVVYRELVRRLPHPRFGSVPSVATPIRFVGETMPIRSAPPDLGEHTEAVLADWLNRS